MHSQILLASLLSPLSLAAAGADVFPVREPAHNGIRDTGLPKPTEDGTTFLVTESAGKENGPPFIAL